MSRKKLMEPIQEKYEKGGSSEETHPLLTVSVLIRLFGYLNVDELKTARLVCEHWKYSATPFLQEKAIVKLEGICPICKSEWKSRKKSVEQHNHYETIPFYRFVTQVQHMYPRDRDQIVFYRNFQLKNLNLYFMSRLHTEPTKYFLQFVKLMGSKVFELKLESVQLCPTESIYQIMYMFKNLEKIHFSNVNVWLDPVTINNQTSHNQQKRNSVNSMTDVSRFDRPSMQRTENSFLKTITFSNGWNSDEFVDWDVIFTTCPELQELNLTEVNPSEIKNCLSTIINLPNSMLEKVLNIRSLIINPRAKIEDQLIMPSVPVESPLPLPAEVQRPRTRGSESENKNSDTEKTIFTSDTNHITDQFRHLNLAHLLTAAVAKLHIRHLSLRLPYTEEGNSFPQILEACADNLSSVTLSRHPTIYAVQNDLVFKPNPFEKNQENVMEFPYVKKLEIAHNFIDNFDEIKQSFPYLNKLHLNIVPTEFVCPVGKLTTYHTYLKTAVLLNMKNSAVIDSVTNLVWNIDEARARLNGRKNKALDESANCRDPILSILDGDQEQASRKTADENKYDRGIRTVVYKTNGVKHISKVFPNLTKLSISITRGIDLHVIFRDLTQLHDLTLLGNSFYRVKDQDIIGWEEDMDEGSGDNAMKGKPELVPNGGIKQLKQLRRLSMENNNCCITNESIKHGFVHLKRLRSLYISRGKKLTLRGLRILSRLRFLVYIKVTKLKQESARSKEKDDLDEKNSDDELIEAYELALSKNPTLDKIPLRELRDFPTTKKSDRYHQNKPKTKIPSLITSSTQHQRKYPTPGSYPSKTVMINVSRKGMLPILVSSKQNASATLDYRKLHLHNDELVLPPLVPSQALDTDNTLMPKDDLTINEIKEILDMSQDALLKYELEKRSKNRKVDRLFDQITTKKRLKRYGKYELGEKYHRIGGRRYFFIRTIYKVNGRSYELVRRKYENEDEKEKQFLTQKAWQARKKKEELKASKAKAREKSAKDVTLSSGLQGRSATSSAGDDDGSESEYERSIKDYDEDDDFEEYCDEDDENYLEFKHPPRGYDSEGAEDESSDEEEGKCLEDDTMYEGDKEFYDDSQFEDDGIEDNKDDDEVSDSGTGSDNGSPAHSDSESDALSLHNSDNDVGANAYSYNRARDKLSNASDDNYSSGHFSADKDFTSDSNSVESLPQQGNLHHASLDKPLNDDGDSITIEPQFLRQRRKTSIKLQKIPKPIPKKTVVMTRRRIRFAERDLNLEKDTLTERQNEEETITINDNNLANSKMKKKVSFKTKTSQNSTTYNHHTNNSVKYTTCKKSRSVSQQFTKGKDLGLVGTVDKNYSIPKRPHSVTEDAIDEKIREVEKEFKLQFTNLNNSSRDLDDHSNEIMINNLESEIIPFDKEFTRDPHPFIGNNSNVSSIELDEDKSENYNSIYNPLSVSEAEGVESEQTYDNYKHHMFSSNDHKTKHLQVENVNHKKKRKNIKQEKSYVCGSDDPTHGSNYSIDSESIIITDIGNPQSPKLNREHGIMYPDYDEGEKDVDEMGVKLANMRKEMMHDIMKDTSIPVSV